MSRGGIWSVDGVAGQADAWRRLPFPALVHNAAQHVPGTARGTLPNGAGSDVTSLLRSGADAKLPGSRCALSPREDSTVEIPSVNIAEIKLVIPARFPMIRNELELASRVLSGAPATPVSSIVSLTQGVAPVLLLKYTH